VPYYRTLGQSDADMCRLYDLATTGAAVQERDETTQFRDAKILDRVRLAIDGKDLRARNRFPKRQASPA
jgi:hypothetical protein